MNGAGSAMLLVGPAKEAHASKHLEMGEGDHQGLSLASGHV